MKKYYKPLQRIGVIIGLSIALYQGIQGIIAFRENEITLSQPNFIVVSIFLIIVTIGLQVYSWTLLMGAAGANIPFKKALPGYIITFLQRYIPGTIWGYISRSQWLFDEFQVDYRVSNSVSLVELELAVSGNLIATGICLGILINSTWMWIFPALILVTFFLWYVFNHTINISFVKKVLSFWNYNDYEIKISFFLWMRSLWIIVGNMFLNGLAFTLLTLVFGLSINPINIELIIKFTAIYNLSWLLGFLVFVLPSGLGLRELTFATLLDHYMGIQTGMAIGLAISFRLINLSAEIILVLSVIILWSRATIRNGTKQNR